MPPLTVRNFDLTWRAIIALTICYSAFLAEVFRAGIEAVPIGQIEAARALGLHRGQIRRHIVAPQAFRIILPPLGNDFVSMIKDSALVSALGVAGHHPARQGLFRRAPSSSSRPTTSSPSST